MRGLGIDLCVRWEGFGGKGWNTLLIIGKCGECLHEFKIVQVHLNVTD